MSERPDPVMFALVEAALEATGATQGWLLSIDSNHLTVRAAAGPNAGRLTGAVVEAGLGSAGFVAASGQPLATASRGGDPLFTEGVAALLGVPVASVLSVPCGTNAVVGVLEVVDKVGAGGFTFDDVEIVTLLAGIAGVALSESSGQTAQIPEPAELGGDLARLAQTDPNRYAAVATAVNALLSNND